MAEPKLTKSEQALKKNNPKKFAELMKRRQGSSAREFRLSQQKKAEDAGSIKTTPRGGITAMTLGAGPAIMGIVKVGAGLYKILNDKSNRTFKNIQEASKAAKQRGKFKVGDKTYNSLAAANKARRAEKIDMKGLGPKPGKRGQTFNVKTKAADKPATQQLTGAAKRSKLEAAGKAADKMTKTARGKKITSSAKRGIPSAIIATATTAAAKPKPKSESKSTIADVKRKPKLSKPKPKRKSKAKAVSQAKAAPMMFDAALQSKKQEPKSKAKKKESMSIFDFAAGKGATPRFKQRKSKPGEVTLFGFDVDVDSTDKGMAMEEFDSKYGGQIKGTVKRRMGGKVRGYGKAMRGY
jgi:hypothetical protein